VEKTVRGQNELTEATLQLKIEQARQLSARAKAEGDSETSRIRADAEAQATRVKAEGERVRIQAVSQGLTDNYVRLQSVSALAQAMGGANTKVFVLPTGKDGLPGYFHPFLSQIDTAWTALDEPKAKK
jgi:regulator of protease activity HflC (stomatin/prohibitin superfamily)